jgi:hypothetical protein
MRRAGFHQGTHNAVWALYRHAAKTQQIEARRAIEGTVSHLDSDPRWETDKHLPGKLVNGLVTIPSQSNIPETQLQLAANMTTREIKLMLRDAQNRRLRLSKEARRAVLVRIIMSQMNRTGKQVQIVNPITPRSIFRIEVPQDGSDDVGKDILATLPNYLPQHREINFRIRSSAPVGDFMNSGVDARPFLPERVNGFWSLFLCKHTG